MPPKNATPESEGFTPEERAAMKERAAELRAEGRQGAKKADGLQAVLDRISQMAPGDRALAERVHVAVTGSAPELTPKTWYGMPAYADAEGKPVVFFQDAGIGPWIVVGGNHDIRVSRCRLAHRLSFQRIAVATAANHHDAAPASDCFQGGSDRLGRMREVHIDQRCAGAQLDPLHPARHIGLAQTDGSTFQIPPDRVNHCQRCQRIANVEVTRESEVELDSTTSEVGANGDPSIGSDLVRQRSASRVAVKTDRSETDSRLATDAPHQLAASRIIDVDHRVPGPLRSEQRCLRLEVGLHVAMEIQMISAEVGEGCDVKRDRIRATEHQSMGGDLHHDGLRALFEQESQQTLKIGRLRRRHGRRNAVQGHAVQPETDGTDQPGAHSPRPQGGLEQECGGGLPVGAGDGTHRECVGGPTVNGGGDACHCLPGMVDHDHRKRYAVGDLAARRVGEDGNRPRLGGLLDEFGAVMMRTRQRDVKVAGTYQPGVDADATDNRVAYRGAVPEQLGQTDLVSGARPEHGPPWSKRHAGDVIDSSARVDQYPPV